MGAMPTEPWSHLVPLCVGRGPALFAVHGAAGGTNVYRGLASALGAGRGFYGLRAFGLWQGQAPLRDMQAIVRRYADDIRRAQPRGPYWLLGYSTGGVIAYEMAQRFRSRGDRVAFLGMIDTALPSARQRDADEVVLLSAYFRVDARRTAEALRGASREEMLEYFARYADRFDMVPERAKPGRIERVLDLIVANLRAADACEPAPYAGTLTFFSAMSGKQGHLERDRAWGWDKLAADFRRVRVPGTHFSMMREPRIVEILAGALRASLP